MTDLYSDLYGGYYGSATVSPPSPGTTTTTSPDYALPQWTWALAIPPSAPAIGPVPPGGMFSNLARAKSRKLTMRIDPSSSHEASFSISGTAPEAAQAEELTTDLVVMRNGQTLFRGRIAPSSDSLDASTHTVTVTARSYRDLLQRRTLMNASTLSWTSADQAQIAWDLIAYTQGQSGGSLAITRGVGQSTGVVRTVTYEKSDYIGDRIAELAQMDNGFDWDITAYGPADLRLDIWYPYRSGSSSGVVVEWGGKLVASVTRNVDPWAYANADYVTGDSSVSLTPAVVTDSGIASAPEGRWESAVGTTIRTQSALDSHAAWLLADGEVIVPSYTVKLRQGAWGGPGHIWIGDYVRLRIRSGRLDIDEDIRVVQMDIEPGESGQETVTLTLGRIPPDPGKRIAAMLRRIRKLELR